MSHEERKTVMTQAAKLKTVIRARAAKTGESYTAARRNVLAAKPPLKLAAAPVAKGEKPPKTTPAKSSERVPYGELSDRTSRKSTGFGLEHWFEILDKFGKENGHTKAADHLYSTYNLPPWHGQMITVTWERRRGLRQANQSCTGTFQVSVSRSLDVSVPQLVERFNDSAFRKGWLKGAEPALVKALDDAFADGKSMELKKADYARMRYKWLSSIVELRATGKAGGKTSLVADSSALPDAEAVPLRREAFTQALDRLRDLTAI